MGVNDREKAKLEQEIAELRRKQAKAVEVDKTLDAALSKMRDEVREYDDKYDEQVKRKKEALEKKKFSSSWDPKLTEALEIVRKPLQSYGENCEKAVAKLLKAIEKGLENGATQRLEKAKNSLETAKSNLEKANQNYDSVISKKKEKEAALEAEIIARKEKEAALEAVIIARKEKEKAEEEARKQAKIEAERNAAEEERKRAEIEAQRRSTTRELLQPGKML